MLSVTANATAATTIAPTSAPVAGVVVRLVVEVSGLLGLLIALVFRAARSTLEPVCDL